MSSNALFISLLRPSVLHILRAAGFHATRPAAFDSLVDLASRYLLVIAVRTADFAMSNHNDLSISVTDIRMALQDVGAFRPQLSTVEEHCISDEDLRGMSGFIDWMMGEGNREIRRIAGLAGLDSEATEIEAALEREDFLTALKKKYSKTGEESRYQGTVLGKEADDKPIKIEGGFTESIYGWEVQQRERQEIESNLSYDTEKRTGDLEQVMLPEPTSARISLASSPLSEL